MTRAIVSVLSLVLLVACQDAPPTTVRPLSGTSLHISEARSGGNPDLFFGSPLATNPQPGDANFDVGGSNGALLPFVRICETDGAPTSAGCVTDVTLEVTGSPTGLAMGYSSGSELYSANWQTKQLVAGKNYRVEIWGIAFSTAAEKAALDPRWLFGWRDIGNAPSVSACNGTEPFCLIKYGQTIPVKVRIEQFAFCPLARNCATQFISAGANANLEAKLDVGTGAPSAQLFIPGQTGTNFALSFEPCTAAEDAAVSNAIDAPTFGPCLKTETSFTGSLSAPAIVSLCDELDPSGFGLAHEQQEQLALHHFSNDLSSIQALPEAWQCGTPTSGIASAAPKGLLWLAQALRERVVGLITPRPLMAAAMIDRGGGGQTPLIFSFFKLALPSKFEYEFASDSSQGAMVGTQLVLRAKVVDLFGDAVQNARVRWAVAAPPSDGATVLGIAPPGPSLTDASGIAQNTVQLSSSTGLNVFRAFGRGIADGRATGCIIAPSTPASCNGPRPTFDPFMPYHVPEFDASGTELPVDIADGTRLLFKVLGCAVTVDGIFSTSEWACAKTYSFSANVSGGTTAATLYVINNGTSLYMAVRVQRSALDSKSTLQVNFDNNNSWTIGGTGAAETGDDVLSLDAPNVFTDAYLTSRCTTSNQSSCWDTDAGAAGTNDGIGAVANNGVYTTFELSHPLNTADNAHDFSLLAGAKVGLFLTLQIGSGSNGKTVWPGFRNYLEFKVTP
jgi:hypothetical protein